MKVPEQLVLERDATMWELRKRGLTYEQIGKAMEVSPKTAHRGVQRMGEKVLSRLAVDHVTQAALDLDRIDAMIRAIEALATGRAKVTNDDGEEITLPVSFEAQDRLMKLMAQRAKLLGLDGAKLEVNVTGIPGGGGGQAAIGAAPQSGGQKEITTTEKTPKQEALELIKEFGKAKILDKEITNEILNRFGLTEKDVEDDIVDAEIIEDEQLAIAAPTEAPAWVEEDDSEEWD